MPNKSRLKGSRVEREICHELNARGYKCVRVDAKNNQLGQDDSHDLVVEGRKIEVKCRADGFKELYRWLDPVDVLVVKADRKEPLVVIRLGDWQP